MNRNSLIAVLLGIVLGAIVAPAASSASGAHAAGHFSLALDGGPALYEGTGSFASASTLVLGGGARTAALLSWTRSGELRDVAVAVQTGYDNVVAYEIENAWPKLDGTAISISGELVATPASG
jgi:hypothetical protein